MKKRVFSALLAFCLLFTGLPINVLAIDSGEVFSVEDDIQELSNAQEILDGTIADSYAGGSGTSGDPYLISNGAQLARFANQVNSGAEVWKVYQLTNDIYLNDITNVEAWDNNPPQNQWTPIGTSANQFMGSFSGKGFCVYGLYISTSDNCQGLFGVGQNNSGIFDVGVDKSYIKGGSHVAAVCGQKLRGDISGNHDLYGCYNGATVIGQDAVGGIVGSAPGDMFGYTIRNCHNTGSVTGRNLIGGIVGYCDSGTVSNCYNVGGITGNDRVGGIAGKTIYGSYCWNAGMVSGGNCVAGIIGEAPFYGSSSSSISCSFNTGEITGRVHVAGIVGYSAVYSYMYRTSISNCYNIGTIKGESNYVAGIGPRCYKDWISESDNMCEFTNCYNTGNIDIAGSGHIGPIFSNGTLAASNNLFYLAGCCGENYKNPSSQVTEKNAAEMATGDFVTQLNAGGSAWKQDTAGYNDGYPILNGIDYDIYWNCCRPETEFNIIQPQSESIVNLWDDQPIVCSIDFKEAIIPGPGKILLIDSSTNEIVRTISSDDNNSTNWFNCDGSVLSFLLNPMPEHPIQCGKQYHFIVDPDIVIFENGKKFPGITDKSVWTFFTAYGLSAYKDRVNFLNTEKDFFGNTTEKIGYPIASEEIRKKIQEIIGREEFLKRESKPFSGACFGISAVTCLSKLGMINLKDFDSASTNLYSLAKPSNSTEPFGVRDLMNYYYLLQLYPDYKIPMLDVTWANFFRDKEKFREALKQVVAAGMNMELTERAVMLNFGWMEGLSTHAHSVVLCSARLCKDGNYELLIKDPNYFSLTTMTVSSDFSKMTYGIDKNVVLVKMLDVSDFPSEYLLGKANSVRKGTLKNIEQSVDSRDILSIVASGDFVVENENGEKLEFREGAICGNMTVFQEDFCESGIDDYAQFIFTVKSSKKYSIRSSSFVSITINSDNYYSAVDTDGANLVVFDSKGIDVEGNNLKYKIYSTTENSNNFFSLLGESDSYVNVGRSPDGSVNIQTDPLSGLVVESLYENKTLQLGARDNVTIEENSQGGLSVRMNSYSVILDSTEGTQFSYKYDTDSMGKLAFLPAPIRMGHTFLGWFTAPIGGTQVTTDTVFTSDTTIYAHWQKDSSGGSSGGYPSISYYSVKVEKSEHGTVTSKPTSVYSGGTVTLTVTPDKGYKLGSLIVTDSQGKEIGITESVGKYTFKMPSRNVTVTAKFVPEQTSTPTPTPTPDATPVPDTTSTPDVTPTPDTTPTPQPWKNPFSDVPDTAWYIDAVEYVATEGLMNGYANGKFGPSDNISRAEFAQIIYNKEGRPTAGSSVFTDVKEGQWYTNAVTWAAEQKVVTGIGNDQFAPNRDISREELATMLWRYAGSPEPAKAILSFTDAGKVSTFAKEAILWANENGIVNGKGNGILDPKGKATRAETAQMLMNYLKK